MQDFKLTIHMVSSVDGFVAKKDNSVSWFETEDHYEKGVSLSPQDQDAFLQSIDCYLMGSRTYEHALELSREHGWAYGDVPTIVLTQRKLRIERNNVELFSGPLEHLISDRLKPRHRNVWLVGGPTLTKEILRLDLADEIRQSVIPVILGDGTPFYDVIQKEIPLHLINVTAFDSGIVELHYEIKGTGSRGG